MRLTVPDTSLLHAAFKGATGDQGTTGPKGFQGTTGDDGECAEMVQLRKALAVGFLSRKQSTIPPNSALHLVS